ncbi:MAG: class I SAM-dependent methyltransferase, partial [Thermodesulfobacteriota bacterium]
IADAMKFVEKYSKKELDILKRDFQRSLLAAFSIEEINEQLTIVGLDFKVEQISDRHIVVFSN